MGFLPQSPPSIIYNIIPILPFYLKSVIHLIIAEPDQVAPVAEHVMAPELPVPLPVPDHEVRRHQAAVTALHLRDKLEPGHELSLSCVCCPAHHGLRSYDAPGV